MTFLTLMRSLTALQEVHPDLEWKVVEQGWNNKVLVMQIPISEGNAELLRQGQAMFADRT